VLVSCVPPPPLRPHSPSSGVCAMLQRRAWRPACRFASGVVCVYATGRWDVPSDAVPGHAHAVNAIAALDEDTVVTASDDGFVRLFEVDSLPRRARDTLSTPRPSRSCVHPPGALAACPPLPLVPCHKLVCISCLSPQSRTCMYIISQSAEPNLYVYHVSARRATAGASDLTTSHHRLACSAAREREGQRVGAGATTSRPCGRAPCSAGSAVLTGRRTLHAARPPSSSAPAEPLPPPLLTPRARAARLLGGAPRDVLRRCSHQVLGPHAPRGKARAPGRPATARQGQEARQGQARTVRPPAVDWCT